MVEDLKRTTTSIDNLEREITKRKKAEGKLRLLATHDVLTGLPNRALLYDRFDTALANAQRKNKKVAIMSLDLDRFKTVNDTLGHDVGDKLLVSATGRLTSMLRKVDTVARMGGDEFVLLLWEVDQKDDAIKVAQKILEGFRQPFIIDEKKLNITVSIGVAIYPEDGKDIKDLLKNSDELLYRAKESGRDRYQLCDGNDNL
jgi:diguanylate cyclase (GGDEF)-like protein